MEENGCDRSTGTGPENKDYERERRRLRERELRIDNDLTWKERKMRWNLEDIARREMGEGKRVWVNYRKIQIEGKWWRWEEEEEILKDNKGRVWK